MVEAAQEGTGVLIGGKAHLGALRGAAATLAAKKRLDNRL